MPSRYWIATNTTPRSVIRESTVPRAEPAKLLPPWIHTITGRLPASPAVRTSSVRQSSLACTVAS